MSKRFIATLTDDNYNILKHMSATDDEKSMSKIVNILIENFIDLQNYDFFKVAILLTKDNKTRIIVDNKEVENVTKISYEHAVGEMPNIDYSQKLI